MRVCVCVCVCKLEQHCDDYMICGRIGVHMASASIGIHHLFCVCVCVCVCVCMCVHVCVHVCNKQGNMVLCEHITNWCGQEVVVGIHMEQPNRISARNGPTI